MTRCLSTPWRLTLTSMYVHAGDAMADLIPQKRLFAHDDEPGVRQQLIRRFVPARARRSRRPGFSAELAVIWARILGATGRSQG